MARESVSALVVEAYDASLGAELEALASGYRDVELVRAKGFSASNYTVQVIVPLTPIVAGALALVGTWIRSKRHMSVKISGLEITGLSPKEIGRLLRELRADQDATDALEVALASDDVNNTSQHDDGDSHK